MATIAALLSRIDELHQQVVLLNLRLSEQELRLQSIPKLVGLLALHEDDIRPDARIEIAAEERGAEPERVPTDEELAAIEAEDLVSGL